MSNVCHHCGGGGGALRSVALRAEGRLVVPCAYATLVCAALYDGMIFGLWPDHVSVLGAAVIVAGAVVLAWREGRAQRGLAARAPKT